MFIVYLNPTSQQLFRKVIPGGETFLEAKGKGIPVHEQRFVLGFGMGRVASENTEMDY